MMIFATRIGREFRGAANGPNNLPQSIDYVRRETQKLFKIVNEVRGSHVHEARYDDAELRRLSVLEMMVLCG